MAQVDYRIDASTFQEPLVKLAEVLAQKVRREAPKLLQAPEYVSIDLHVLMRQAMYIYNLLFYLNADERRENRLLLEACVYDCRSSADSRHDRLLIQHHGYSARP